MTEIKYGVIDIGSNSVRLMLAENGKSVKKEMATTRLAQGMKDELLNPQSSLRTLKAVLYFADKARAEGADKIVIFATAAVRSAKNGGAFCEEIEKSCGVRVDVLSGETEAKIGVLGALCGKDGAVIDVGGASSEIAVIKGGKFVYSKSLPVGAVTLTERFGQDCGKIRAFLNEVLKSYGDIPAATFYAVGGTATTLAAVSMKLSVYDAEKVDGYVMHTEELSRLTGEICALTVEERKNLAGLQKERADIIHSGALILKGIANFAGIDSVTVRESDNLEGYLKYFSEKV